MQSWKHSHRARQRLSFTEFARGFALAAVLSSVSALVCHAVFCRSWHQERREARQ